MDINRHNYEAFLLDLMEGKLSLSDQQKLRDFLSLNPDCSPSSMASEPWFLEPRQVSYSGREDLKKELPDADSNISESNFDLFCIARMEGDLNTNQEWDHQQMVERDEEKGLEWSQWQETRLVAHEVKFRGKNNLKKKGGIKRGVIWISVLSSAAAIALLLIFLRVDTKVERSSIAEEISEQAPSEASTQESTEAGLSPVIEDGDGSDQTAEVLTPSGESLAQIDDPVLFSIKKVTDAPVESGKKDKHVSSAETQDSLLPLEPKLVESRPVRLADNRSIPTTAVHYDQIRPLDIPPTKASIANISLAQIAEYDVQEALANYKEEKDISVWSIANAGIKGINKITGANMSLLAARDEKGSVSGFRFKSKRFSVASPVERSE